LAILKIIDGPAKMMNQELKIFTESVSLGRDPQMADFTFYSDSNSSISGVHAKLELKNGEWKVIGVSKSGNETFLEDEAIPNFQPYPIYSGQRVRIGYIGQQPVEMEFTAKENSHNDVKHDVNTTRVNTETTMPDLVGSIKGQNGKPTEEDPFAEFRELE
jgi:pSer/pThr/pTyr-binding forkhead associated (FHA) protein